MDRIAGPLHDLLAKLRLSDSLEGWRAVDLWRDVVGDRIADRARATAYRDGVLEVEVETAAWMNELTYMKRRLVQSMNQRMGSTAIRDIRLKPASPESSADGKSTMDGEREGQ